MWVHLVCVQCPCGAGLSDSCKMGSPLLRKLLEARRAPLKLSCIAEMHQIAVIEGIPCLTDHKALDTPLLLRICLDPPRSAPAMATLLLDVQTAALSHAYLPTPLPSF